eukprot:PhM_4_TR16197/c0_g2_i1/m.68873
MAHSLRFILVVAISLCTALVHASSPKVPSPVLAISFHKGSVGTAANVFLYNLDGSPVGGDTSDPAHLIGKKAAEAANLFGLRAMRGLGGQALVIAVSNKYNSSLVRYQPYCTQKNMIPNHNAELSTVDTTSSQDQLLHPYDIARVAMPSGEDELLVSNQDNNAIVHVVTSAANNSRSTVTKVITTPASPRGLTTDGAGRLWVCGDDANAVWVYNMATWSLVSSITLNHPIGARYDAEHDVVLITTKDSTNSAVVVYNATGANGVAPSPVPVRTVTHPALNHGAGLASHDGWWYVLSQDNDTLLRMNLSNYTLEKLTDGLKKTPEQIDVLVC